MRKQIAIFLLYSWMCIAVGYAVAVYVNKERPPSCVELSKQLIPYKHCLQQGGLCTAGVDFFIEYYDIKWKLESRCPDTPR